MPDTDTRALVGIVLLRKGPVCQEPIPLDSSPVDWLGRCIADAVVSPPKDRQVMHYKHPSGPSALADWMDGVRLAGYPLQMLPYAEWRAEVAALTSRDNPLYGPVYRALQ